MALSFRWRAAFNAHSFNVQQADRVPSPPVPRWRSRRLFRGEDGGEDGGDHGGDHGGDQGGDQGAAIRLDMRKQACATERFGI